jgi:hypothetical protein
MKHVKHYTKNQKLINAGRAGKMVNVWGYIAEVADKVCDYALSKQDRYITRQKDLIGDIMAEEMLGNA